MLVARARCLVTGSTSGIGRAVALELAHRGASLVVSGRDPDALTEVAGATGGDAVRADLTSAADLERLAAAAGAVDAVVHAAGAGLYAPAASLARDELERLIALNVTAPIALTTALLPGMLERRRGHLSFVGSIAGRVGRGREAVYAATKAAVSVYADSLRMELRGSGVGVLVVTPGPVATPFFARRGAAYDRRWPRPIAPERVAVALVDAIEADRTEVTLPRWLALPARLRGAAPGLYRALAGRFD
ncbi:MAG TPA: SDR family NAD(P)-dependent oxidoreductase [Gaiellaceae bacterium]